jgi:hypothetical protein
MTNVDERTGLGLFMSRRDTYIIVRYTSVGGMPNRKFAKEDMNGIEQSYVNDGEHAKMTDRWRIRHNVLQRTERVCHKFMTE